MNAAPTSTAAPAASDARNWTVLELLRWTTEHFARCGIDTPRLDAEVLLACALEVERIRLYVDFDKPVSVAQRASFRELVKRRAGERFPVSHLVGRREFWSLSFKVTPEVLTPRPETETLVAAAVDLLPPRPGNAGVRAPRVLDVGTGCGAVALALASERSDAVVTATDVSGAALEIARQNADAQGRADRIDFREGSFFAPVAGELFDLIVSNPPYLAESRREELPPELNHEPDQALFSGPDGLDALNALVDGASGFLEPGGALALELSPEQAPAMLDSFRAAGFTEVRCYRDLAHENRVVSGRWSERGE